LITFVWLWFSLSLSLSSFLSHRLIVPAYQLDLFLSVSFFNPASSKTLFVAPTTSVLVLAVPTDSAGVGGRSDICGIIAAHVIATAVNVRSKMFCFRSADGIGIVVSFFESALSNKTSSLSSFSSPLASSLLFSASSSFSSTLLLESFPARRRLFSLLFLEAIPLLLELLSPQKMLLARLSSRIDDVVARRLAEGAEGDDESFFVVVFPAKGRFWVLSREERNFNLFEHSRAMMLTPRSLQHERFKAVECMMTVTWEF